MTQQNCPKCGSPFKVVPGGVSKKTGKPYQSFTACSKAYCDGRPGDTSVQGTVDTSTAFTPPPPRNFDKENFGKCKYGFLIEAFKYHLPKGLLGADTTEVEKEAEKWADMAMRRLGEPDARDYGTGIEVDQVPFE